uniref:Phostensin/Taperin PP1-binding domain-containing protein n=1 Tax=Buteo japonicus TaxID=224669 RepID=A0A8C0BZK1_9AVES
MEFSSVPLYRPHSAPHQRGGSTFTVVSKRKPVASGLQSLTDASGRPQREEEEEEEEESKGKGKAVDSADGPQVGMSHKKRYPTVNEIEVIGGYLSLERSCMSKTGSRRKKVTAWGVSALKSQATTFGLSFHEALGGKMGTVITAGPLPQPLLGGMITESKIFEVFRKSR